ncbi:Gp19/Gp15/Gp42 family protein [Mycolicibacterium elephantis]
MTYAKASDVQTILGRELTTEETALVERRLAQVERMILRRIPNLATQIDAGDLDKADVIDIEAEAVYRVIRNPEGVFSEQDGSYGYQLSREAADNSLRITAEEWERLGIKPSRMFSIVPNLVAPAVPVPFYQGG